MIWGMQAGRNFLDEWQNMRSMFVNDEFRDIADAKDSKNLLNKVCARPQLFHQVHIHANRQLMWDVGDHLDAPLLRV